MNNSQNKITYGEILLSEEFQMFVNDKSEESKRQLDEIRIKNPELQDELDKAQQLNSLLQSSKKPTINIINKEKVLNNILSDISFNQKQKKSGFAIWHNPVFRVAASIVLIVGLSVLFSAVYIGVSAPGKNQLVYNEIIVPSGEKSQVILSDGTKIWLNSESKLRYPAQFAGRLRNVYLEGEAYFDVSKIKNSKFLVHTQGVKIEVLGTVFNVKSYPDDETVETSVVEGKVKVDAEADNSIDGVILLPKEKAIFNKKYALISSANTTKIKQKETVAKITPLVTISNVNIKNVVCWKDHLLVFDNETFEEIAVKMARWYKIHVQISDEGLKKQRFTGKFINNETFYQVLDAINYTTPIDYSFAENKLTVSSLKHTVAKRRKNY